MVAYDAVGPAGGAGTGFTTSPGTWTHVNGGNGILVGVTIFNGSANTVTGVTYGGVTVPFLGYNAAGNSTSGGVALYGLVGGTCPTGSNTVSVAFSDAGSNHNAGSVSVSAAGSLGTVFKNGTTTSGSSCSQVVTGTTTSGLIVAVACYGTTGGTFAGTNSVTIRWSRNGSSGSGADNGVSGTVPSTGGGASQTVGFSNNTGTDSWGIIAVEVLPAGASGPSPVGVQPQRGGRTYRRKWDRPQQPQFPSLYIIPSVTVNAGLASGAGAAQPPVFQRYITGLAGTGTAGYFTDQFGAPRLFLVEQAWALPMNAGRWNSGNWQADIDAYMTARAAQGYTAWAGIAWSSDHVDTSSLSGGRTWDGIYPIVVNGTPGKIATGSETITLNNSFWTRIDYLFTSARAHGITCFLNLGMQYDFTDSANIWFNMSTGQAATFGTLIAARYPKSTWPNVLWFFGDDGSGSQDTFFTQMRNSLVTAGDTSPVSTEQLPETDCHVRFDTGAVYISGGFGMTTAGYNWVYSYDPVYLGIEKAYTETGTTLLPVVWGDGVWYGDTDNSTPDYTERRFAWWALASGARGINCTSGPSPAGHIWQWDSAAVTSLTTDSNGPWCTATVGTVTSYFTSLAGWHTLVPDTGSVLVTAGRGTKSTNDAPGFNTAKYGNTDAYVAASRTPDGGSGASLAVIYCGQHFSITIDQTKMVSGYTATWVDPATCATSTATVGATYNSTGKGNNSAGNPDWVLVLQGPTAATVTATLASGTGTAQGNDPAIGVNAVAATEVGGALNAAPAVAVTATAAAGTGAALSPPAVSAASATAVLATGTGTALNPAIAAGVNAVLASGAGTALNATVSTATAATANAGAATGTGTGLNPAPATGVNAAAATGAGAALNATASTATSAAAILASGAGTARNPAAAVAAVAVLPSGTGAALNAAVTAAASVTAVLAAGAGAALGATASTAASGTANAILAAGTGTAQSPAGAGAASPAAILASGAGTARNPAAAITVTAGLATGTGTALNTAFTYAHAGLAAGTGTAAAVTAGGATFRLFPATAGPGTAITYTGNFVAAVLFEVTQATCWFQGFWWWVCGSGQSTTPVKCSLGYYGGDFATGTAYIGHVAASAVTSGTLTAGAWNYIPLPVPVQLTPGTGYLALVGVNGNFPYTASAFNTGDTYAAGITNGPLTCFSGVTGTVPGPYGVQNMLFETATGDPELVTGLAADSSGDHAANFWVDVQVSGPGATPPGYAGSYRLFPSSGTDTATEADSALNYVVGTEVHLAQLCTLNKIWFYSYSAANQLPTACTVWDMGTQAAVAGTASPSWSGAAGSGWMSCTFTGVTLPAGAYYVTVYDGAATPTLGWSAKRLTYWGGSTPGLASPGLGGIVNGPLSAPDTAHASTVYQWANNSGSTPPYTTGVTEPGQSVFAQGPPNQYPYLYVDGLYQNYWVDLEVTAGVNAAAGLATGAGTAQGAAPAVGVTAALATGAGTALGAAIAGSASVTATVASGTGAALGAVAASAASPAAAAATGTGTAQGATITAAASPAAAAATGTGAAQGATASTTTAGTANAAAATGTGAAGSATPAIGAVAAAATEAGAALGATVSTASFTNAQAGLATGTGTARNPGLTLTSNATAAPAAGTGATAATAGIGVNAIPATGAGTGRNAAGQIGWVAPAGLAAGTGTAQPPVAVLVSLAQAAAATGLGAALRATAKTVDPFTVGALTTATAGGVLTAATSSGGGTLTASDQRTGGPT